jgi:hypothetical protein
MYDKKIQLELLDEVAQKQRPAPKTDKFGFSDPLATPVFLAIDLRDSKRQWNYDWLVEQDCISTVNDDHLASRCVRLSKAGEALRFQLLDQFQHEQEQRRVNRYVILTFWVALATLMAAVVTLFQCNRHVPEVPTLNITTEDSVLSPVQKATVPAQKDYE